MTNFIDLKLSALKNRIKELEQLLNAGDGTYTDEFELEELRFELEEYLNPNSFDEL